MKNKSNFNMNQLQQYFNYIRSSCDIVKVAGDLGVLPPKRGRLYQGNCPSGHPSEGKQCFAIYPDTQSFYCFHCNRGGDVIRLASLAQDISYREARKWLVNRYGLQQCSFTGVTKKGLKKMLATHKDQEKAYDLLTAAARYYHTNLKETPELLDHLHNHYGLKDEIIESHSIGLGTGTGLEKHLRDYGFTLDDMALAGVMVQTYRGPREVFTGRLVFPYWKNGRVVYMIGRKTRFTPDFEWEKAKYKKLRVSKLVENSHFIGEDSIRDHEDVVVAEGITDALAALQEGFACISPVTTRFRRDDGLRLLELTNEAKRIYLVPDNEESQAGLTGALDTAHLLESADRDVFLVLLPRGADQEKMDLNEFLRDHGVAAFNECLQNAKPPVQILIDSLEEKKLPPDEIIENLGPVLGYLAHLPDNKREDGLTHLKDRLHLEPDQMNTVRTELDSIRKQGDLNFDEPEKEEQKWAYSASFENLVDLVLDDDGRIVYLIKENGKLFIADQTIQKDTVLLPPPPQSIHWDIPNAREVMDCYENDTDDGLFKDLTAYHKGISELPGEGYYSLLALFDIHTYLYEKCKYSPILLFYAIPERGKTRTGKGILSVAWRGVQLVTLVEAHLLRLATDHKATIFCDLMDAWDKAKRNQTQDILLNRFEKGATVPRVHHPEKGAFQDTVNYNIYGPTIIATNEPVNAILYTRAIEIVMPETTRRFDHDVNVGDGLPFRARLIAFRARWLDKDLPQSEKPIHGRLGDIMRPLRQILSMVSLDEEWFLDLVKTIDAKRKQENGETPEAQVVKAICEAARSAANGHVLNEDILEVVNQDRVPHFHMSPQKLGKITSRLGFSKYHSGERRGIYLNEQLLARLCLRYGITRNEPAMYNK